MPPHSDVSPEKLTHKAEQEVMTGHVDVSCWRRKVYHCYQNAHFR